MDKINRGRKKRALGCDNLAGMARQKCSARSGTKFLQPGAPSVFIPCSRSSGADCVRRCVAARRWQSIVFLLFGKKFSASTGECRQKGRSRVSFDKWLDTRFLLKRSPPYLSLDSSARRPPLHSLVLRTSLIASVKFVCKRDYGS